MKKLFFLISFFISLTSFGQIMVMPGVASQQTTAEETLIRSINATYYDYQRSNIPVSITNTSVGLGHFTWSFIDLSTNTVDAVSYSRNPTVMLSTGVYLLHGSVQGLNDDPVERFFWNKVITVLPPLFTEGEADRVLSLDDGNNIFDASGWADGERIFLKKIDATVGRIRINDYTSATKAHLLIDPSSQMEVDEFDGSSGLYLVNCQNLLIDGVGLTDNYGLYLNGIGDNTAHAIVLNTISDIRCEGIEIYGVKINVPQTGASALRILGDESATYNRGDPSVKDFKFAHIWVVESGHEGLYAFNTGDGDTGDGGPRKGENLWAWDWIVDESSRDAMQIGNCINCRAWDWVINASGTLGEPSHNSYIVCNPGNENLKVFNIRCKGGSHGINLQYGDTGSNPMMWNITMEVETLASQSTWNFLQVGDAPNSDLTLMNITLVANTGDEIVYRFDSQVSQGTQDIDDLTLINITDIKGTSANFWTQDGTNSTTNFDITSGNVTYIPATAATALLDATTHLPSSVSCPSITGGVAWTTRRTLAEMLGDFDGISGQYDIEGYISTDGEYWSGAGSGITLKLNDL